MHLIFFAIESIIGTKETNVTIHISEHFSLWKGWKNCLSMRHWKWPRGLVMKMHRIVPLSLMTTSTHCKQGPKPKLLQCGLGGESLLFLGRGRSIVQEERVLNDLLQGKSLRNLVRWWGRCTVKARREDVNHYPLKTVAKNCPNANGQTGW